tara:strand:- start:463 stop:1974 length:1512 start_codon:yes stop_codon:yes gene_type:complete
MARGNPHRWTLAVSVALAMMAGACGGADSDGAEPAPTTAAATTVASTTTAVPVTTELSDEPLDVTTTVASTTTAVPATTESPDEPLDATTTTEAPAETTTTTTEAPVVLTDSFRGVTVETIKVGFASIDFEEFTETYGIPLPYANYDDMVDAYVAHINSTGGIHGRMIELVHSHFLPVGPVSAEATCVELAEDHRVFVVLNGFAGPGAESTNLCFPGTYDTILIGGKPTPEQLAESTAPWISYDISLGRRGRAFVNLLSETGRLEDLGPIMIFGANVEYEAIMADTKAALTEAGMQVPISVANTNTGDETATIAFLEVLLERARSEAVSTIFFVGEANYAMEYLFRLGDEFTVLILNGDSTNSWMDTPPEGIESAGQLLTNKAFESSEDANTAECMSIIEPVLGLEVLSPDLLESGQTNYWAGSMNVCKSFELFRYIATAAGPDLTNDSFREAAESLGTFSITAQPYNSIGPEKADARDTLWLAEWSHEEAIWIALSNPTNVR